MDAILYMTWLIGCFQPPQRRTSFFNHSWRPYNFALSQKSPCRSLGWVIPAACIAHCPLVFSPPPSGSPAASGCFAGALGCSRTLWIGCLPCSARTGMPSEFNEGNLKQKQLYTWCKYMLRKTKAGMLTAPVLVLSILQSGMILESVTIQLLILSLRRLSTDGKFN